VSRSVLLDQLAQARRHIIDAVDGLSEAAMQTRLVPSRWTPIQLLNHLSNDDELFWIHAVLEGDSGAISAVCDGWHHGPTCGNAAIAHYEDQVRRSDAVLADADLDAPPAWRPDPATFDTSDLATGWDVVFRVLVETTTHAGHLDIVRELLDGHQHLVVD
jgi:hypothetical protein